MHDLPERRPRINDPEDAGAARRRVLQPGWHDIEPPTALDRLLHSLMAEGSLGISPARLALAWCDWGIHLAGSPGKWRRLWKKALRKQMRFLGYAAQAGTGVTPTPCIAPLPQDERFRHPAWQSWPFNLYHQSFLLDQQWWHNATTGIGGVARHHEEVVAFTARQMLDVVSPVNCVATNPEVLEATVLENGGNLVRGAQNLVEDVRRVLAGQRVTQVEAFRPGREVARTPGRVVYRNRLIELLQYAPQTPDVHARALLIVPAWITKYYLLDLSPHNSLVGHLVGQGYTVFMISWRNPDADDRDLGMDDYLRLGVFDALDAIQAIIPGEKINAVGYCIGGTLLSIAAAALSRKANAPLHSITLLAAQTDFTDAGEPSLFIDDSELVYLDNLMWRQGYLDTQQMAGAFQLLRANDLVCSRMVSRYLLGRRPPTTDLMAWNADATRMPYRMHSEYLHRLFHDNELFEGRYRVDGKPVALSDIDVPIFALGAENDRVAPWRSVHKIVLVADTDVTFLLTNGGHNAGIVSEPGHAHRHFRIGRWRVGDRYIDADHWFQATRPREGSWWHAWTQWLAPRAGEPTAPPPMGAPDMGYEVLEPAPGRYVLGAPAPSGPRAR